MEAVVRKAALSSTTYHERWFNVLEKSGKDVTDTVEPGGMSALYLLSYDEVVLKSGFWLDEISTGDLSRGFGYVDAPTGT